MPRIVNTVSNRLSLRPPQRASLDILRRITEIASLNKDADPEETLDIIKSEFPSVESFEREFPSICFALATGVGKTRLMGAFIAYLHQAHGIKHFMVLAPNLTIYNKLITDFTPNTPKYVLQGIDVFAVNPPEIITGDNYESGRGVRNTDLFGSDEDVHINIFNISKINRDEKSAAKKGQAPRIKRLSEYLGESYFEYLSNLDDLVLLMDESHRYRGTAGVNAINELRPVLGLELTATPQTEKGTKTTPFQNVIFSYPLSSAMNDGFVKEPAVATRENFNPDAYNEDELERLKLEDGIRIHEATKVDLEVYARENDKPIVKPFVLVVAQNVEHAADIQKYLTSETFFNGYYKDRVITVHSGQRGEEKDENVESLLAVEDANEPTEIVIHVNMLKEGWDVTNLYTIIPLRAANSKTLVEQSIGRGLRLPYGRRTGVPAVDRLTIVAHDKFQSIIDEANNPDSIIRTGVVIGRDVAAEPRKALVVPSTIETRLGATGDTTTPPEQTQIEFTTSQEQDIAKKTLDVIRKSFESLPSSGELRKPEVQKRIVEAVRDAQMQPQAELGLEPAPDIEDIVARTTELVIELSIDIPKIVVVPVGDVTSIYHPFTLDLSRMTFQPVSEDILIQQLRTHERDRLSRQSRINDEDRLENYIVRNLIDFDDISYDDHADLLYDLAGQAITHIRNYLPDEDAVLNVVQYYQRQIAELIHTQMQEHYEERASGFEPKVSRGFTTLKQNTFKTADMDGARHFRTNVTERLNIRNMAFDGFKRCLYPVQKFDTDTERRFAIMLEDEAQSLKWFKPAKGQFQIWYQADHSYEPDFVVETDTEKFMCEPKRAADMEDPIVLAKAAAAIQWCKNATSHEAEHNGKPWSYLLIPHDAIDAAQTLDGLKTKFIKS